MTCEHANCQAEATVKTRFGDGTYGSGKDLHRQTFVRYCDDCFQEVGRLFVLCDVAVESGARATMAA